MSGRRRKTPPQQTKTAVLIDGNPGVEQVYDLVGNVAAGVAHLIGVDLAQVNYVYGKVLEYPPGAHIDWHTDRYADNATVLLALGLIKEWQVDEMAGRILSIMVQLSDDTDYEGGDLELVTDDEVVAAPRGRGSIIVASADTEHRVTAVTAGCRLSLVCFLGWSPRGTEGC